MYFASFMRLFLYQNSPLWFGDKDYSLLVYCILLVYSNIRKKLLFCDKSYGKRRKRTNYYLPKDPICIRDVVTYHVNLILFYRVPPTSYLSIQYRYKKKQMATFHRISHFYNLYSFTTDSLSNLWADISPAICGDSSCRIISQNALTDNFLSLLAFIIIGRSGQVVGRRL